MFSWLRIERLLYWAFLLLIFFVFDVWLSPHVYRFPILAVLVVAGIGGCFIFVLGPLARSSLNKRGLVGLYLGAAIMGAAGSALAELATYHPFSAASDLWWVLGVAILFPGMLYVYQSVLPK
jgi:hypothetical protein